MGGNVSEWTTESYSSAYTDRGGRYYDNFAGYPAGSRNHFSDGAYGDTGFRLTLFL